MSDKQADQDRYLRAIHAMQTGVRVLLEHRRSLGIENDSADTSPKHLRVGVNSALVDSAALASLLIAKGVFTESEYFKALADAAEEEVTRYETRIRSVTGNPDVRLG